MNESEMKAQALLERVSELTTSYENKVADLRVQLTVLAQEKDALLQRVHELEGELSAVQTDTTGEDLDYSPED